jgi:phosphoenolpyruvate-protein phosphotransferase
MKVLAPLSGWALPLAEVPDEVFAAGMAGDGVAIDPTSNVVCAPFDGEIVPVGDARHAVTVRSDGGMEILVHVGVDTVALGGAGFELLVKAGERVASGAALLRFDMDAVARNAKSLVTPVILGSAGTVKARIAHRRVTQGEVLFEVDFGKAAHASGASQQATSARFRVPFDHGLHVRPAALVAAALKPYSSDVRIALHGRDANARSSVGLMALGARCGDTVEAHARGPDAAAAIEALASVLTRVAEERAPAAPAVRAARPGRIEGVIAGRGVCVGVAARWVQADEVVIEEGAGAAAESRALETALQTLEEHLTALAAGAEGARRELLRAHAELARDPGLVQHALDLVREGRSAGSAWRTATRASAELLAAMDDARMRERASDLRDLERQVLRVLRGAPPASAHELPPQSVVIADDLLPSQFIALDASRVAGLALARGGATSHVAILAASCGMPALFAAGTAILDVADGTPVILDAEHGWIDVDPPAAELAAAAKAAAQRASERATDLARAHEPAVTVDGVRIVVNANAGSAADARAAMEQGADGCGLLRTEFLFLDRRDAPGEEEQAAEYARIAQAFAGRPVNVRTLDIGGDKPIAYLPLPREDNPALGLRGVRTSLAFPELLRAQLRAIVRAGPACRILVPMVNELAELAAVRAMAVESASAAGVPLPAIGVMIETPAAALAAATLAREADFLSIGSNDLAQYALAIDRGHADLAHRLDALHPSVLLLIAATVEGARAHGRSVSVCGAMASDVDALPILIGLGVHEISATPSSIPRLKRTARLLDAAECRALAARALDADSAGAVRELAFHARARARASSQSASGVSG